MRVPHEQHHHATHRVHHSLYAKMVAQQVALQQHIAEDTATKTAAYQKAVCSDNVEAATRQHAQRAQQSRAEAAAALHHIHAAMTSQLLTEDPSAAASMLGEARIRPDHFKGMSEAQRRSVFAQQAEQVAAHKAACRAAQQQERAWAAYQQAVLLQREAAAEQANAQRRASTLSLGAFLREQQAVDARQRVELERVYAPKVSDAYFSQFQTSHR